MAVRDGSTRSAPVSLWAASPTDAAIYPSEAATDTRASFSRGPIFVTHLPCLRCLNGTFRNLCVESFDTGRLFAPLVELSESGDKFLRRSRNSNDKGLMQVEAVFREKERETMDGS